MVENHFAVTPVNAKTQELKVTPATLRFDGDWGGRMTFLITAPLERVEVDEWDCPFCKATVYETEKCECGAYLEIRVLREDR